MLKGLIRAGVSRMLRMDALSNSLITIGSPHHKLHEGAAFMVHISNTTANTDDHRTLVGFTTPNTAKHSHMIITADASSAAEVFVRETSIIDDDAGTELVIYNRSRNSSNTSGLRSLKAVETAEVTWMLEAEVAGGSYTAGTELQYYVLVAGSGPKALGGATRDTQEIILKQNTKYTIVVQNIGASVNIHRISLDWYEHTDSDA